MLEFDFDLQRFDDGDIGAEPSESEAQPSTEEAQDIPEELGGLPEDIARKTMEEWESTQSESAPSTTQEETKPGAVPYDRFKEKVDEANRLKAQLEEYQRRFQAQQQQAPQGQQQQPPPQPQPPRQPPLKITPEISKQINKAIEEEALSMTGLTKKDLDEITYADDDDPRVAQWNQAKAFATSNIIGAIRQAQAAQQQQAQAFLANHAAAVQSYNDFATKAFAEPDFKDIQNFAVNEFFTQLNPYEQQLVANSYLRVERQIASPAEMKVVTDYFDRAKAVYRSRTRGGSRRNTQQQRKATTLPRTDQIKGSATFNDGQLSERDIEKMLEGDFTELNPQQQRALLALS